MTNPCKTHTDFRGDLCPVCLMNEVEQLRAMSLKQLDSVYPVSTVSINRSLDTEGGNVWSIIIEPTGWEFERVHVVGGNVDIALAEAIELACRQRGWGEEE